MELGYALSSEEHDPEHLVAQRRTEGKSFLGDQDARVVQHAVKTVREEDIAESIICGPDARRHLEGIQRFVDAGYDHVYVHQVGPDQEGFFRFYEEQILPAFR